MYFKKKHNPKSITINKINKFTFYNAVLFWKEQGGSTRKSDQLTRPVTDVKADKKITREERTRCSCAGACCSALAGRSGARLALDPVR